jgi:hypothetical protein
MIPDDILLTRLHELSGDLLLTPDQTQAILSVGSDTLKDWRAKGDGIPFVKLGTGKTSPVRYRLEAVRDYIKSQTYQNTTQAKQTALEGIYAFAGAFNDWVGNGNLMDGMPIINNGARPQTIYQAIVNGVEFVEGDVMMATLGDYLGMLHAYLEHQRLVNSITGNEDSK